MTEPRSGVGILGLGKCVPKNKVSNEILAQRLSISADEIIQKTAIATRHHVSSGESASQLSTAAAAEALQRAGITAADVDLIIGLTTSGDYAFPALSSKVQALLTAKSAGAFDLSASASSFPVAASIASDKLRCDHSLKHILVVAAAVQSPFIDWDNPDLAVILGDGAGAAVFSRVPQGFGVLSSEVYCDGSQYDAARLRGGGSSFPLRAGNISEGLQYIEMDGVAMGREFLKKQPRVIERALKKSGRELGDVDLFIFHQANGRLIKYVMEKMGLPMSKTYTNAEQLGNTAEASIPTALYDAYEQNLIKRGCVVVLSGVGAGSILATTVIKWY